MHNNLLQYSRFPVYGESACVLKGRHGGLVGTKALGEENGPCLSYEYDWVCVCFSMSSFASQWML